MARLYDVWVLPSGDLVYRLVFETWDGRMTVQLNGELVELRDALEEALGRVKRAQDNIEA